MERETLFNAHLKDLRSIRAIEEDIFFCPICLSWFSRDELQKDSLSIGHIWPEYIRKKSGSKIASRHKVLLCTKCNTAAGSRGDRQAQLFEQIRDGDETGHIFGKRNFELAGISSDFRSLLHNVEITRDKDGTVNITGNNPQDQSLLMQIINRKEPLTITVHPPHEYKPDLPQAGWITSAYLLAFFCFGYRYIAHEMLDPVRGYILKSFEKDTKDLKIPDRNLFAIGKYEGKSFSEPMLFVVVPLDGKNVIHLQVIFLEYMIKLPLNFDPNGLGIFWSMALQRLGYKESISELQGRDEDIFIQFNVDKPHSLHSPYDTLFGKAKTIK
jgi:hypothetical protein